MRNSTIFLRLYLKGIIITSMLSVLILISCDELLNPSPEYLIDKELTAGQEEQTLTIGNEFQIVFPANSLTGNLKVQVKKESSPPIFNIQNMKLGSNIYKIKFAGLSNLESPVKITINYDKSQIPAGRSVSSCVKSYVYSSGVWKPAKSLIDNEKSQLIITVSADLESKNYKDDNDLLDSDEEIIVADGYNTSLTPVDDNEKCDCGWEVDYSQLNKVDDAVEKTVHYVNKDGKKHGPSLSWWDDERKKPLMTQCFFEGLEHGLVQVFWTSGALMGETTFNMGKKSGYYNLYFENGVKSVEGNYANDKKEGLWISWYETGKKNKQGNFLQGLETGIWTYWYPDGRKYEEGKYQNGKSTGDWFTWHENGALWKVIKFVGGSMHGKFIQYWDSGNKEIEGLYSYGKQSGIWIYYDFYGKCQKRYDYDNNKELLCL